MIENVRMSLRAKVAFSSERSRRGSNLDALRNRTVEIAAAYLYYLCGNHPFVDGNKRTALAACLVFLEGNGLLPDADLPVKDVDAWEMLVLDVASGKLDRDSTTKGLRRLLKIRR